MRTPAARVVVVGLAILLAAGVAASQDGTVSGIGTSASADRATGTALVIGRVVDAKTGEAIPAAAVALTLVPPPAGTGGAAQAATNGMTMTVAINGGVLMTYGDDSSKPLHVLADADGEFVFRDLPAGSYDFSVTAAGFSEGGYNQQRAGGTSQALTLADGQHASNVTIELWKQGAITGRVIDDAGEPVVGTFVRVLRRVIVGGQAVLQLSGAGRQTDDRGVYRAYGLDPGDYVVAVPMRQTTIPLATVNALQDMQQQSPAAASAIAQGLRAGGAGLASSGQQVGDYLYSASGLRGGGGVGSDGAIAPAAGADGHFLGYQTVFYPSAPIASRATTITIEGGEEKTGIDIQLSLVPTYRVSGTVTDPNGNPAGSIALHLLSIDADQSYDSAPDDAATSVSDPNGAFTILGVPPGQYELSVVNRPAGGRIAASPLRGRGAGTPAPPMTWASAPVSVGNADVTGVAVSLRFGFTVTGTVTFDGTSASPNAMQLQRQGVRLQPARTLAGAGRAGGVPTPGPIGADGSFSVSGCIPGRYTVAVPTWPPLPWIVKSVTAQGHDVSDIPLEVSAGDLPGVVIGMTDRPAQVTGTVRTAGGEIDPTALVVMFPADPHAWGWPSSLHSRNTRVSTAGTFSIGSLAPGDYLAAAVSDDLLHNWQDPKILERLATFAVHLHLDDGGRLSQDLTTSTIK